MISIFFTHKSFPKKLKFIKILKLEPFNFLYSKQLVFKCISNTTTNYSMGCPFCSEDHYLDFTVHFPKIFYLPQSTG